MLLADYMQLDYYKPIMVIAMWAVLLLCVVQSLLKGWMSFFLVPFLLPVFLVVITTQHYARKQMRQRASTKLQGLMISQLVFVGLLYTMTVGLGDTKRVLLFGFLESTEDSLITAVSGALALVGLIAFVCTSVFLIARLSIYPRYGKRAAIITSIASLVLIALVVAYKIYSLWSGVY